MQFHRFRLTTRWLMVAVAVIAIVLAGQRTWRRWTYLRAKAALYAERERRAREGWIHHRGMAYSLPEPQSVEKLAETKQRFECAARRPWEAIPADLVEDQGLSVSPAR